MRARWQTLFGRRQPAASASPDIRREVPRQPADPAEHLVSVSPEERTGTPSRNVFVARQPIYDAHRQIHAYELLFRRADTEQAAVVDGNLATAQVLLNAVHIGLEQVSADHPVFINCTREVLMSDPILPPDRCVLEVLEDIAFDRDVLERMRQLRSSGYRLALDDFVYSEASAPAVQLAHYVKLDVLRLSADCLQEHVRILRPRPVLLLAEKVDSEEQLACCRELGFHLFQGYYLRRPEVLSSRQMQTSKLAALQLISKCQNPNARFAEIGDVIRTDLSMTFSLLRLANSAAFGGRVRIDSVSQAISRLGMDCVIRWALLLVLAGDPDCPKGYIEFALQRARMCEMLALNPQMSQTYYLVGLLSLLDSIFGVSMEDIVQQIPLTPQMKGALLHREGELGEILRIVLAYEDGNWDTVMACSTNPQKVHNAYWQALDYASTTVKSLFEV